MLFSFSTLTNTSFSPSCLTSLSTNLGVTWLPDQETCKLYYLQWLGLALYPVLVFAAPLPGCGAVLSVPAALPPLFFLTSKRRKIKSTFRAPENSLGGWDAMDLPFWRGWSGFHPRAPGTILTPPPVAPCNTLSGLSPLFGDNLSYSWKKQQCAWKKQKHKVRVDKNQNTYYR